METVARLHSLPGVALVGALTALGVAAAYFWLTRREPARWLDVARRILLAVIVAEAAVGLALVLRGSAPAEWIHWLYGAVLVVALLLPAAVGSGPPARTRSALLAGGAAIGAAMAWRLMGSG